jgi:hypothetical protein
MRVRGRSREYLHGKRRGQRAARHEDSMHVGVDGCACKRHDFRQGLAEDGQRRREVHNAARRRDGIESGFDLPRPPRPVHQVSRSGDACRREQDLRTAVQRRLSSPPQPEKIVDHDGNEADESRQRGRPDSLARGVDHGG